MPELAYRGASLILNTTASVLVRPQELSSSSQSPPLIFRACVDWGSLTSSGMVPP